MLKFKYFKLKMSSIHLSKNHYYSILTGRNGIYLLTLRNLYHAIFCIAYCVSIANVLFHNRAYCMLPNKTRQRSISISLVY